MCEKRRFGASATSLVHRKTPRAARLNTRSFFFVLNAPRWQSIGGAESLLFFFFVSIRGGVVEEKQQRASLFFFFFVFIRCCIVGNEKADDDIVDDGCRFGDDGSFLVVERRSKSVSFFSFFSFAFRRFEGFETRGCVGERRVSRGEG